MIYLHSSVTPSPRRVSWIGDGFVMPLGHGGRKQRVQPANGTREIKLSALKCRYLRVLLHWAVLLVCVITDEVCVITDQQKPGLCGTDGS